MLQPPTPITIFCQNQIEVLDVVQISTPIEFQQKLV